MRNTIIRAGLSLGFWLFAYAQSSLVSYPAEYRHWVHVKSTIVGPKHPSFATNGGIHHFYANAKALEGYKTGKFPDGSVLIDDLLEAKDTDTAMLEGTRRRLAVMEKDASRFRDTGGWGYEVFKGDEFTPALNAEGKASCFACHGKQKDHDSVFSSFRK